MKYNIEVTFTKAFAFVVLVLGCTFAFLFKNAEVIIFTLSLASGLAGLRNWNEAKTEQKRLEFPGSPSDPNPSEKDPEL